jgi:V8-like Glu-specific endopeptidase
MLIDDYQLNATLSRYRARRAARQRNLYKISRGELLSVDTPERVMAFLRRRGISATEAQDLIDRDGVPTVAASEGVGAPEPAALERILGTSDLMGIAFLERGLDVARTVARIWVDVSAGTPAAYGTGFMVSPRLVMTNHHVIGDPASASSSMAQFNYQLGPDGNPCPAILFRLDPGTFFVTNRELDYTLVAVAPAGDGGKPLTDFGFNPLFEEEGKAIAAQWLNIIQHPSGGYKQLAFRENRLIDVADAFLTYQTDTAPGSSGSPIYNDRWEVVGIHHSGVAAKDSSHRTLAIDGSVWTPEMGEDRVKWIANEGIRISRIIADIRAQAVTGPQREFVDQLLSTDAQRPAPAPPPASPAPSPEAGRDGQSTHPEAQVIPTTRPGEPNVATWTIPLTVTVSLPGEMSLGSGEPATAPLPSSSTNAPAPDADPLREAKRVLGAREDILSVRLGYVFENGWITRKRAIVVKVKKRATPFELRRLGVTPLPDSFGGLPVEVVNPTIDDLVSVHPSASQAEAMRVEPDAEEILYEPPQGVPLQTVAAKMKVTACLSPDHGWPVLQQFLAATTEKLVVGMYDFGATHIADEIEAAAGGPSFSDLTLAIQAGSDEGSGTKANDLPDEEMVARLGQSVGGKFRFAWVKIGIKNGWVAAAYHIKVAVRDGNAFWLSSGNWQSSNQPPADPLNENPQKRSWLTQYNREWHVVVEGAQELASVLEKYIRNDFERNLSLGAQEEIDMPDILFPGALLAPAIDEAERPFTYFAPFEGDRAFQVTPLLTPDNYNAALMEIVRGAKSQLLIQNQTFNAARDNQAELGELLDAILDRQRAGVDVRIIFRIIDPGKARENLEALQDRGFDLRRIKVQTNCHTKGVIVDGARVMIGSQNLSQLGITLNRDASLLFEDEELAGYFAKAFEHDWQNLARQDIGREDHAPEIAEADAATPDGMIRLSWKDYVEMG